MASARQQQQPEPPKRDDESRAPTVLMRAVSPALAPPPRRRTEARQPAPQAPSRPARQRPAVLTKLPKLNPAVVKQARARLTGEVELPQPPRRAPTESELEVAVKTWTGEIPRPDTTMTGSHLSPLATVIKCRPDERSALALKAVLQQFAPAVNPRYSKGERGHLFVWDVASAMECVVPRFRHNGERTLRDVVAWFRTVSTTEQWVRVTTERAQILAGRGHLVVALPKTRAWDAIAIVEPGGSLRVASACQRRQGLHLTLREAFGVGAADFFFHV